MNEPVDFPPNPRYEQALTDLAGVPRLSTGQPSTLKSYRDNCRDVGFNKAAAYFDTKIAEQGEDQPVIADEQQMLAMIASLESQ